MEQPANELTFSQLIVQRDGGASLFNVNRNAAVAQQLERLRTSLQHKLHAACEDDDLTAVIEELCDIGWLNTRDMLGTGFVPIPGAATAWKEFEVFACSEAFDVHSAPGYVADFG